MPGGIVSRREIDLGIRPEGTTSGSLSWLSGINGSSDSGYLPAGTIRGDSVATRAEKAFARAGDSLAATEMTVADVTSVTEYVASSALKQYGDLEAARVCWLGGNAVPVRTKIVEDLLGDTTGIEVEVTASRGDHRPGGERAGEPADHPVDADVSRWHRSVLSEVDGLVLLPTLLPIDRKGRIIAGGDFLGQYAYVLERAAELLEGIGMSITDVARVQEYSTPPTVDEDAQALRRQIFGPIYPASFGILNNELHIPGVLVALDLEAARTPRTVVNPGWARYEALPYVPAIRTGRTLLMSGTVALDQAKAWPMHYGKAARQAQLIYENIDAMLAAAGASRSALVTLVEYLSPAAVPYYAEICAVRQDYLGDATPAITTVVSSMLKWPTFMMEVVSTAYLEA
jgi:enamine deaminase RidA (YjgF/YER057c/UK114 family)